MVPHDAREGLGVAAPEAHPRADRADHVRPVLAVVAVPALPEVVQERREQQEVRACDGGGESGRLHRRLHQVPVDRVDVRAVAGGQIPHPRPFR